MAPKHISILGCDYSNTSAFCRLVDKHPVKKITILN